MRDDLRRRLVDLGASDDDLTRAVAGGWLPLLALDRMLMPGTTRYDIDELADRAGMGREDARHLWRAMGFPDVPSGMALFSDRDLEAARLLCEHARDRGLEPVALLPSIRVISAAFARVAAVEAEPISELVAQLRDAGASDDDVALAVLGNSRFATASVLVEYVHHLQLRAAVWRQIAFQAVPDISVAIGFADLAGYTELTSGLDPTRLAQLVERWEGVAYDSLAAHGARVVKTIGDEVMFAGLPAQAVPAALALRDAAAEDGLPALRIGIAAGAVLPRDGDFYGPVVNLASRITEVAEQNEILVASELAAELEGMTALGLEFRARGRPRLRSIGEVEVFAVERAG
jgi:adenylate cyclase